MRTMYRGTVEYLEVTISADEPLTTQPVEISFDRVAWHAAQWIGEAGNTRTASILLGTTVPLPVRTSAVYVRLSNTPEAPIIHAGTLRIR